MQLTIGKLYLLNKEKYFKIRLKRKPNGLLGEYDQYIKLLAGQPLILTSIKQESIGCLELTFFVKDRLMKLLYFTKNNVGNNFLDNAY